MSDDAGRNLAHRALSACVFVPVVLGLSWVGGWALFVLVAGVVGRGTWELLHMARQAGHRPAAGVGVALALATCLTVQLRGTDDAFGLVLVLATLVALVAALRHGVEGYLGNALITLGGVGYLALLGTTPLLLARRLGEAAPWLLIGIFGSIWLTDAAAYAAGLLWGRRRLVPTISPGKTVVGFVGGLVGGLVPLVLAGRVPGWTPLELAGMFLLVGLTGQVGDIVESAIKRDLGVKDAPTLIPGHGGLLDRFDSYLFAFPAAYAYTALLKS